MGTAKDILSEKKIKAESKHYSDFFDAEICEDFHIHWRNTRLQFNTEEFEKFCCGIIDTYNTWVKIGKTEPRPEWTLPKYIYGPVKVNQRHGINPENTRIEIQKQPDYIHFHYKSIRLDLSIEEFLEIAKLFLNAKKKIQSGHPVHDFDLEWRAGHIFPLIFKENKEFIKGNILHVGCNAGTTSYFLTDYGYVVGIDINKNAILKARELFEEHNKKGLFIHSDVENMDFVDNSFDCCIILEVLEHLYEAEQTIKEVRRVVKNGGYVLISVPRADYSSEDFKIKQRAFDPDHKRFYINIGQVVDELKDFEIVKTWHEIRGNPARPKEKHDNFYAIVKVVK